MAPKPGRTDPAPTDTEVGGGESYDEYISPADADAVVSTADELTAALHEDATIYIDPDAQIDLSARRITLPTGVTLASDRGQDGSRGGLIACEERTSRLFQIENPDVRITGLRLRGPELGYYDPDGSVWDHNSLALRAYTTCEIDNCELYGWPHAGIGIGEDGDESTASNAHVHHCSIHDNQMDGLGYGVVVYRGDPLLEYNYFDANRHSIAADGAPGCSYEARYNIHGPNGQLFGFEMHAPGGDRVDIHHNTFENGELERAIALRGVPTDGGTVEHNWFYSGENPGDDRFVEDSPVVQYDTGNGGEGWQNITLSNNHFGESEPSGDIGHPRGTPEPDEAADDAQEPASNPLDHTIVIEGNGEDTAHYAFSVSGEVRKSESSGTINTYDTIDAATVSGRTTAEPDAYTYSGEISGFDSDAPVTVRVNGTSVSPDATDEPDTILTIEGKEATAHYEFSVSGEVRKSEDYGGTLNDYDAIEGETVTGRTTREPDSYAYSGNVVSFDADAPVDVYENGERVTW